MPPGHLLALRLAGVALAACGSPAALPAVSPPIVAPSMTIARGAYLAGLGACAGCHGRDLGGELGPNLTGLRWTDPQLVAAIRDGVRPDGTRLSATMPYPYFHVMTDADAVALVAYVRSRPRVAREVPHGGSSQRAARRANTLGVLAPVALAPARDNLDVIDDAPRHGEYLATLMRCTSCHGDERLVWPDDHPPPWPRLTDADAHAVALYLASRDHQREEQAAIGVEARSVQ